jgi:hypothetical protein
MLLYLHLFIILYLLHVSIQMDHHQAVCMIYHLLLNCVLIWIDINNHINTNFITQRGVEIFNEIYINVITNMDPY